MTALPQTRTCSTSTGSFRTAIAVRDPAQRRSQHRIFQQPAHGQPRDASVPVHAAAGGVVTRSPENWGGPGGLFRKYPGPRRLCRTASRDRQVADAVLSPDRVDTAYGDRLLSKCTYHLGAASMVKEQPDRSRFRRSV